MQFDTLQLKNWKKKKWLVENHCLKMFPGKGGRERLTQAYEMNIQVFAKKQSTCIHYLIFSGKILPTFNFQYCVISDYKQPDIGTFLVSRNCALWGDVSSKKLMNFFHNTCYVHTPVKMHKFQSTFSFRSYWISSGHSYDLILIKMNYLELGNDSVKKKNLFVVFSNTSQNIILQYFLSDKSSIIL